MTKTLERDLNLFAVVTISVGAMVGSGIFVLPGIASTIGGPAVILAYLLAGLTVFPAALSKAEMATAMPHAGGTYLFIDRALGPMMGTIAGFGAWFSLVFKSAFALLGLGGYVLLFVDASTVLLAVGLALFLMAINIIGVGHTARLQNFIVTGVVTVLFLYIVEGITWVEAENFHPFFAQGFDGLLAATGFVFVSYAGVTKIASVAEEVENPGRNIPLGIFISLSLMMVIYTLVVYVIVGVTSEGEIGNTFTPMAVAAEQFLGSMGVVLVAVTAVFALTSMANAGILSSSRYPFAMSRDRVAPAFLQWIHPRFRTPMGAILVTGGGIVLLILTVPVVEIAKLASAFKILLFTLVNLALFAFRESRLNWYRPRFRAPGYPWVQLLGMGAGLLLLTQMGWLPLFGAIGIIGVGSLFYAVYGRSRADREGASYGALRRTTDSRVVESTRLALDEPPKYRVLIPVSSTTTAETEENLLRLAAHLAPKSTGQIQVMRFEEIPDQLSLDMALAEEFPEEIEFETLTGRLAGEIGVAVEIGEVVSHDRKRAVRSYVRHRQIDLVLTEFAGRQRFRFFTGDVHWLMEHLECDSLFFKNRLPDKIGRVAVLGSGGPYDALKIRTADRLVSRDGGVIQLIHALPENASEAREESVRSYHQKLAELCGAPTESRIRRSNGVASTLYLMARQADVIILGASDQRYFRHRFFTDLTDLIASRTGKALLVAHAPTSFRRSFLGYLMERIIYRQDH